MTLLSNIERYLSKGSFATRRGDSPYHDAVATTHAPVLGIDVGGSGIKGAPVDVLTGDLVSERIRLKTPQPATPGAVAATVAELVGRLDTPGPIGITLPAVVRHGMVETAANIDPSWIGANAHELFGQATGRAVAVVNDADAAGLAEVRFGAGKGRTGVILMLTLGTGIGSALFIDGVLVPNTELGHVELDGKGDAEDWAAASVRDEKELSWKDWAKRLQRYFSLLESVIWPDLIIIGGGVSDQADKFLPRIALRTEIVPATLANEAGIVGAAMVVSEGRPSSRA
jgi:polyphosphate glucokinase